MIGFIRNLNNIEQAFTFSNDAYPLTVLCALHLTNGPSLFEVKAGLEALQARHKLLRANINKKNRKLVFTEIQNAPTIPLEYIERINQQTWQETVNRVLNIAIDRNGILMKSWYIQNDQHNEAELIVGFHHSIIDGTTARLILDELLSLISGEQLAIYHNRSENISSNINKASSSRIIPFIGRQLKAEWKYRAQGAKAKIPSSPENATLQFRLSVDETRKLTLIAGKKGISLNSLISSVMLKETIRQRYPEKKPTLGRTICFTNLRTIIPNAPPASALGCYTSMVRLDLPLDPREDIWDMAERIKKGIFKANRQGDILVMNKLSKYLFRLAINMKKMRLGNTALSFIGKLDLKSSYGSVKLKDVNAFITNNQFGPELSAFAKVFQGQLGLDFIFLTAELENLKAKEIVMNIHQTLEKITKLDQVNLSSL